MKFTSKIPKTRDFSPLKGVQTDSVAQPAAYSTCIVGHFKIIERPVRAPPPPPVSVNPI
jgi:hypothetical protein